MSGGHFQYNQHRIEDIADEIENILAHNDDPPGTPDDWDTPIGHGYKPRTAARLKLAAATLRLAAEMAQRADWLICGDDGEESFATRFDHNIAPHIEQAKEAGVAIYVADQEAKP